MDTTTRPHKHRRHPVYTTGTRRAVSPLSGKDAYELPPAVEQLLGVIRDGTNAAAWADATLTSVVVVQLAACLRREYAVDVPVAALLLHPRGLS